MLHNLFEFIVIMRIKSNLDNKQHELEERIISSKVEVISHCYFALHVFYDGSATFTRREAAWS